MKKQLPKQFVKTLDIPPLKRVGEHKALKRSLKTLKYSAYFTITAVALYGAVTFYNSHEFRSPVIFQNPFPTKIEIIKSPVGRKTSFIPKVYAEEVKVDYEEVADKIFQLESSSGKNDGCMDKGLFNGYGYRQNTQEWVCYPTREEVREHVINRLKELSDLDLPTALCYYNTGYKVNDCTYYKNYQSI